MIDVRDYLIAQAGKDWADLLSGYANILPAEATVWLVNRLGDVILVSGDESIHLLDVGGCRINRLASNQAEFIQLIDEGDNAENWLMISFVDRSVQAGMKLSDNLCYGFKVPLILGGRYEIENIEPTDLSVHYWFMADIFRQTQDVPDGTKIRNRSPTSECLKSIGRSALSGLIW